MPYINILSDEEIKRLYELPQFDDQERAEVFKLSETEQAYLESLKDLSAKIDFTLQVGYFKTTAQFFKFTLQGRMDDTRFIIQQYFPQAKLPKQAVKYRQHYKNQQQIRALHDFNLFTADFQQKMLELAQVLRKRDTSPRFIFNELLGFCNESRTVIPAYGTFQFIISTVLQQEENRLFSLLKSRLSKAFRNELDALLRTEETFSRLRFLKKEPKEFSTTEIRNEIQKHKELFPLYKKATDVLLELEVSPKNIAYYGNIVEMYNAFRLKRLVGKNKIYLSLLCYIHQRLRIVTDHLITFMNSRVEKYHQEAIAEAHKLLIADEASTDARVAKAAELIKLYGNQKIADQDLRPEAFKIVPADNIEQFATDLTKKDIQRQRIIWEHLGKQSHRTTLNLRPIFESIEFSCPADSDIQTAITFMHTHFKSSKTFSQYQFENIPTKFISKAALQYVIDKTVDPNDKRCRIKTINAERYEFMFYQQLCRHIESGHVFVKDSIQYRTLEDDLIPYDYFMANKEQVLKDCGLPLLIKPIKELLQELSVSMAAQYQEVNQRIDSGQNTHIKLDQSKATNTVSWRLPYKKMEDAVNNPFYEQIPSINIRDIIGFAMENTQFDKAFVNILPRYSKLKLDKDSLTACLVASATGTGNERMGEISDVNVHELNTILNNFCYPESLRNANDFVANKTAKLKIFEFYNLSELGVHASVDGQKVETKNLTIYARYSKKYFGFGRGRSSYTLVANHLPLNGKVIGTNDHESHHLLDIVYNNSSEVDIVAVSGDTHSVNRVNFALLYLFGYRFMPRFRNFPKKAQENLVCFGNPEALSHLLIKPKDQINEALIIREWDNVLRILASLAHKETSQANIVKKLSSYKKLSPTLKALIEFDNIIMSLYMLEYIDDSEMRSNVHRSLNRGESFHQLMSAIRKVGGKKLLGSKSNEFLLYNECTRLIANCVIYYNAALLSSLYEAYEKSGEYEKCELIKRLSPVAWQHINLVGKYEFHIDKTSINLAILIDKIINNPKTNLIIIPSNEKPEKID